mgnify:CR=1 FL=1
MTLDCAPSGRNGSATITAKLAGETLACESLNLTKAKQRADFIKQVCNGRPGIDAATVEAELLKAAADLAARGNGDAQPQADAPEVDVSHIIRPERFIVPEVSGVAIPSMMPMGDTVAGRWLWYLRWQDGTRERRSLASALDLPGNGGRLWVHPQPAEPGPTTRPGWSAGARRRWLAGEPAPNAVDVFNRAAELFARFIDLPRAHAPGITATAVCWAMLTYVYHAWPAVPYLFIGGPLGSGKSRLFEVLARLVFRPLASSNLTAAALFRTLHAAGGCLLLDEAERLKQSRDPDVSEILSMLLAGYKRGGAALRLEPVGDSFRPVSFDVYGPKALACIAGLPPALASRSIPITMFRAAPGSDKPKRRIDGSPADWQKLRDDLHALALEHGPTWLELADRADVVPRGLSGRDYELWQPLLAIAAFIEEAGLPGLVEPLQAHALEVAESAKDDAQPDHDETLLRLLADAVRYGERPTPGDLLARAKDGESGDGFTRWTPRAVAEHLKRYGLATAKSHGKKRYTQVSADDLVRIEESYGIDLGTNDG